MTRSSRLPTPGTGPTGGRSPSFTNLKTGIRRESTAPNQTGLQRERSFIEKNFVETLKQPQVQVNLETNYCLRKTKNMFKGPLKLSKERTEFEGKL